MLSVEHLGTSYGVLVHVPPALPPGRRPALVVNLHASGSNAPAQMEISGLRRIAGADGFVVLAPSGVIPMSSPIAAARARPEPGGGWAWNVPGVPTTAGAFPPPGARDDLEFLRRVLDVAADRFGTDPARTYVTGFSGGARMACALACRLADRIAAIAPVAGLRAGRPDTRDVTVPDPGDCRPSRPVPVVAFHGLRDEVNPYGGSPDLRWGYPVPVAAEAWARWNGCRAEATSEAVGGSATRLRWADPGGVGAVDDGGADVELYTVTDGGHTWPGTEVPLPGFGRVVRDLDAASVMARFFASHPR